MYRLLYHSRRVETPRSNKRRRYNTTTPYRALSSLPKRTEIFHTSSLSFLPQIMPKTKRLLLCDWSFSLFSSHLLAQKMRKKNYVVRSSIRVTIVLCVVGGGSVFFEKCPPPPKKKRKKESYILLASRVGPLFVRHSRNNND